MLYFRSTYITYIIYLFLFFNIEKIGIWRLESVKMDGWIYTYGAILSLILYCKSIPSFLNIYFVLASNASIYVICKVWFLGNNPLLGGIYTYLSITEMTLLSIIAWLAYRQSQAITDFENAVTTITFETANHPIPSLDHSFDDIQEHMRTSRRHNTPISLVMIRPDPTASQAFVARAIQNVQRSLQTRHTLASLGQVFAPLLRRADLVVEQHRQGQLMILCPMTDAEESNALVQRLHATAQSVDIPIHCGSASFPQEALTFDELITHATSQLSSQAADLQPKRVLDDMGIAAPATAEVTWTS